MTDNTSNNIFSDLNKRIKEASDFTESDVYISDELMIVAKEEKSVAVLYGMLLIAGQLELIVEAIDRNSP